ncbi:MAG: DNA-binding protein [Peptostreptococcaceae bacterium]
MKGNERIKKFLELQSNNVNIDDIAKELGITVRTLKGFLNKNGYKLDNGKYVSKNNQNLDQIVFTDMQSEKKGKNTKKTQKKSAKVIGVKEAVKKDVVESKVKKSKTNLKLEQEKKVNNKKVKKDKKINITQEDLDKICEVYDWYLQVKDFKSIKPKKTLNKKDINIEGKIEDIKNTSIRVDKETWEEFERLCSNSQYNKQEIITQALKDFMKQYKNLL